MTNVAVSESKSLKPQGFTIWMTGLSGSGKSTLAGVLKERLENQYRPLCGES